MRFALLCVAITALAGAAHAGAPLPASSVPEIDGLAGLAALAAIGGALALAIERTRGR